MNKIRVFISSVQSEFAEHRRILCDYIISDALLGKFFEPFIFENVPAVNYSATSVYSNEVEHCDIYLGIFGKQYGFEDAEGVSPTEREFDLAGLYSKIRLVFLSNDDDRDRDLKERILIEKAQHLVVRKQFASTLELKTAVYVSLIRYLEEKEYIRTTPFDATLHPRATLEDLDNQKIKVFVSIARAKRGFPFSADSPSETILTHLNLIAQQRITNAAILLFAHKPQHFFISSEIKCAHFHGTTITKPIPSYQVYKGDVFQLVNQAVDFVLSRIDVSVGTREQSIQVPIKYELPPAAVTEAIVNAVAHRDYNSNGSIQVMLFKDRLEIWNPGSLPYGLTTAKLRKPHSSIPANPLLAEPMYLAGFIERMGTGTGDIIRLCEEAGLKKAPEFVQEEIFKTILWRKNAEESVSQQSNVVDNVVDANAEKEKKILKFISENKKITAKEIALKLELTQRTVQRYLKSMQQKELIQRIGTDNSGYWELISKDK